MSTGNRSASFDARLEAVAGHVTPDGAIDPADANGNLEWLETMGKAGFSVACIQAPYSPELRANSDFEKRLGSELAEAGLGHLDSAKWGDPVTFFFYLHSKSLAAGLQFIKSRLAAIGLLPQVRIGYADTGDKCWRKFYPELETAGT
jgi:hypothetical protein